MAVAAHADDEVLLCGGTLHKAARRGHEATVLFCTGNEQGRAAEETSGTRRIRAEAEAAASSHRIGFEARFLPFEDMHLAEAPGALLEALIGAIRGCMPDIVITHVETDWHIDHRTLGRIVPEAALQSGYPLAGAAPWKPQAVLHGEVDLEGLTAFTPHLVSALDAAALDARLDALSCYPTLVGDHGTDEHRLKEQLLARARQRGRSVGVEAGEAFAVSPMLPLDAAAAAILAELLA